MPRTHPAYAPEFRRQMVKLVRSGRSVEGLAREFEPSAGAIRNWVKRADLDEGRRSDGLTTEERAELRRLKREVRQLHMEREILKKAAAWFAREATRSGNLEYRATTAQWHADRRAKRPKVAKLAANGELRQYVQDRLGGLIAAPDGAAVPGPNVRWVGRRRGRRQDRRWAASWSPEQIANRLRVDFPDDESMRISHEAIYQALYVQGRGALRRELTACLRTGRALRVPRARARGRGKTFVRPEIMISERPAEADDRAVPGQYTSIAFGLRCREVGVRPSMGSVGDTYDNALCESFFATLECELLDPTRYRTQAETKMAVFRGAVAGVPLSANLGETRNE